MANTVKFPHMVQVMCDRKPTGDIRTRQPKSPGQKAVFTYAAFMGRGDYSIPQLLIPDTPTKVWANETNIGYRCTKCGSTLHPPVK